MGLHVDILFWEVISGNRNEETEKNETRKEESQSKDELLNY